MRKVLKMIATWFWVLVALLVVYMAHVKRYIPDSPKNTHSSVGNNKFSGDMGVVVSGNRSSPNPVKVNPKYTFSTKGKPVQFGFTVPPQPPLSYYMAKPIPEDEGDCELTDINHFCRMRAPRKI